MSSKSEAAYYRIGAAVQREMADRCLVQEGKAKHLYNAAHFSWLADLAEKEAKLNLPNTGNGEG